MASLRIGEETIALTASARMRGATVVISSDVRFAHGCGASMSGKSGKPSIFLWALAETRKSRLQITAVGIPRCSKLMPSRTLHEVHDPQSPTPVITASHWLASATRFLSGAGFDGLGFCR